MHPLDHQPHDLTRSGLTQTVVHEKTLALGPGSSPWDWLPIVLIWPQQFSAVSSAPVRTAHRAQLHGKAGANPFYHFLLRASTTADPSLAVCRSSRFRSTLRTAAPGSRKRGDPISKTGQQMAVRTFRAGIPGTDREAVAFHRNQVGDRPGINHVGPDREVFDVWPEHRHRA